MDTTRKMRFCPCCGQKLKVMNTAEYRAWLKNVAQRLYLEDKLELADALIAFKEAIACEEVS